MTRYDYHLVMKRSVQIAQLKAKLSAYLREVRKGGELVVMDRKTPIARIVPNAESPHELTVEKPRPGSPRPCEIEIPDFGIELPDVLEILHDERTPWR